ncbi:MobF family relaxase [Actinopolymorpha pittospori]|uniref:Conjugative relaxase-like TrwC/TraI family protein n=1 Tax=Actinopolymorpha pittospori TaxID=648752 RepID=A0A927MRI7_9ACTN|nr:MobF family relaxase [Actinopolymorpha pittospori]MBE1605556.1 conjugative relaxase-like TrwC/TraI family protein [Actinopolymorpha pittospori]
MTVSSGHSAGYLTGAVAAGRENYYTGAVAAGEPPGRWWGKGAEKLGLTGLVDAEDMTALYEHFIDPRDPAFRNPGEWAEADRLGHTGRRYASAEEIYAKALAAEPDADPERREQLRLEAGKKARANVAFLDATFSVQKSVTLLQAAFEAQEVAAHRAGDEDASAAWAAHRHAVETAIWAGNHAALEYLAEHAGYSRVGHHGGTAGRYVDAHEWTVASFFQHDNRNHDPQLHIHNAILNRVQGADGEWRTLDSRAIHKFRGAAAAVGERTMEEHLTRSLGVRFATRPDGKAREVVGIRKEVLDLFSTRRRAITAKTREMVKAFETRFGRGPNSLELDRLQRQATFATRRAKAHEGETVEQRLNRWDQQLRGEVAGGLAEVAQTVLALAGETPRVDAFSPVDVVETALAEIQATKAAWTRADLVRAVNGALPDYLGGMDAAQIRELVESLADAAITSKCLQLTAEAPGASSVPDELRLADGRSAYDRPSGRLFATLDHLSSELALRAAAVERGAPALTADVAASFVARMAEAGIELGADQAAAVRGVLTSGAKVEALVGPAGTGKSFVVGALARAWQDPTLWDGRQRLVVGLAASQIATEVLAGEGLAARNITRWLAGQQRLAEGSAAGDDPAWALHAGDLVVVDESAMAATADLTAIRTHVQEAGAKLLLVGDHRQLAAVGAGGGMGLVASTGVSHELAEVRRFTAKWERDASLRLREGDDTALAEYRKHGRIVDAGTIEQAEAAATRAYLGDTLAGRHTLLITDTNEQASRVAAHVRAELVRLGRVSEHGVQLGLQGTVAGVGDLVQARQNGWHLANHAGNQRGPINREHYRVLDVAEDGSLIVAPLLARGPDGENLGKRMTLPPAYVEQHLTLGYASTVHAAQGITVDSCHTVATARTGAAALYVGMSRGRDNNTVYVTTRAVPDDAPVGATAQAEHRDPLAVLAGAFEVAQDDLAAAAEAEDSAAEAASIRTAAERFADVAELATAGRAAASLDRLVHAGLLTAEQRQNIAADEAMTTLTRVLRQAELAGHNPHTTLASAVTSRPLNDARSLASVLHHRITETVGLEPTGDSYTDWIPAVDDPARARHLTELAHAADTRRAQLGAETLEQLPQWAQEALGPPPDDQAEREQWIGMAGLVAAHRELTGHDDETVALPGPPKRGQIEEYASWRAAWRALGRPEAGRAEAEMSDGQLRVRVRAYEREKTWQPAYVAHELAGTNQAEQRHRHTAHIRAAEAEAATDPTERARLTAEAVQATALADALAHQRAQLERIDQVRALWYAHTAETRAVAERARAELAGRGVDPDQLEDRTTPEEWLAAHAQADQEEDAHRPITEADLADVDDRHTGGDLSTFADEPHLAPDDIRTQVAEESAPAQTNTDDWTTVPTPDQTADTIARAQRALRKIQQRHELEERHAQEEARTAELSRWRVDDQAEEHADADHQGRGIELSTPLD